MSDHRWTLNEEDEWDYEEERSSSGSVDAPVEDSGTLHGQDPDRIVTVHVTNTAEVVSVEVADTWKASVDPRALQANVLSAANAATMQALAKQVENTEQNASTPPEASSVATSDPQDDSPLSKADINRLLDAVSADLETFTRQISEIAEQPTSVASSGGHAHGSVQRGQILSITIDSGWASVARRSEIETELLDLLSSLQRESALGDLAKGPQTPAIDELNGLLSDPHNFLRRLGLQPPPPSAES